MGADTTDRFQSGAIRALVALHEREMRTFFLVWKLADKMELELPPTLDSDCSTTDRMIRHVLNSSCGYLHWVCKKLKLPKPDIYPPTEIMNFSVEASGYLESLLNVWSIALVSVTDKDCNLEFKSSWNVYYCIDGMLEHAVMHPLRHSFQLEKLIG